MKKRLSISLVPFLWNSLFSMQPIVQPKFSKVKRADQKVVRIRSESDVSQSDASMIAAHNEFDIEEPTLTKFVSRKTLEAPLPKKVEDKLIKRLADIKAEDPSSYQGISFYTAYKLFKEKEISRSGTPSTKTENAEMTSSESSSSEAQRIRRENEAELTIYKKYTKQLLAQSMEDALNEEEASKKRIGVIVGTISAILTGIIGPLVTYLTTSNILKNGNNSTF